MVGAEGRIEALIAGMQHHVSGSAVARMWGVVAHRMAVRNLAADENNRVKIGAEGGIEAVVAAMKKHGQSDVQEQGCAALRMLAQSDGHLVKIRAADGIWVVTGARQKLPSNSRVQTWGSSLLTL
eukprot:3651897-Rhodomonas_salina.1